MPSPRLAIILLTFLVLAVYYPVISTDYAFSDDYGMRYGTQVNDDVIAAETGDGRFFYVGWIVALIGRVRTLADYKFVRMATVLGVVATGISFFHLVRRWFVGDTVWAACLAGLFAVNPGLLILAGWAGLGSDVWAVFLGLTAGLVLLGKPGVRQTQESAEAGPCRGAGWVEQIPPWRYAVAGICLFSSLAFYQSSAMAYWLAVLLWIVSQFDGSRSAWKTLLKLFVFFGVTTLIYMLVAHQFLPANNRLRIGLEPIHRPIWFVHHPLSGVFRFPMLRERLWSSALLGVPLLAGFYIYMRRYALSRWTPVLFALLCPLCILPTLVAAQYYDVFRTRVVLYGYVIFLWSMVFAAWANSPERLRAARRILVGVTLVVGVWSQFNLWQYFVLPLVVEHSFVEARVREYVEKYPDLNVPIWINPVPHTDSFAGYSSPDEWGTPSSSKDSVGMVWVVLSSVVHRPFAEIVQTRVVAAPEPRPAGAFEIDLQHLQVAQ